MGPTARAGLVLVAVLVVGCSPDRGSSAAGRPSGQPTRTLGSGTGGPAAGPTDCPAVPRPPDPQRPQIGLDFAVSADLSRVSGTEHVVFTPDRPIRELVFRLTANAPASIPEPSSITVVNATAAAGSASPAGPARFRYERAGARAGTPGGLLVVPLARQLPAGRQVSARIGFTLSLGVGSFDRFGHSGSYAWWGSGQPLFAWEPGHGWHREPLLPIVGETATSETARVELTITAPARLTVLATGSPQPPASGGGAARRWRFAADAARDVSVAVGTFRTKTLTVGGTRLIVGSPVGSAPDRLLAEHARAVSELSRRFGPFPFPVLTVARLPVDGGGIEYPGSILMLDDSRVVAVHETAHQWFYGMVGDVQARNPWLDEAFATYAEQLVDGGERPGALRQAGAVDAPLEAFGSNAQWYFAIVYGKGAAALMAARDAVGAERFDAALRCYLNANAWRVARPADLARALSGLPAARAVLRAAGALP